MADCIYLSFSNRTQVTRWLKRDPQSLCAPNLRWMLGSESVENEGLVSLLIPPQNELDHPSNGLLRAAAPRPGYVDYSTNSSMYSV